VSGSTYPRAHEEIERLPVEVRRVVKGLDGDFLRTADVIRCLASPDSAQQLEADRVHPRAFWNAKRIAWVRLVLNVPEQFCLDSEQKNGRAPSKWSCKSTRLANHLSDNLEVPNAIGGVEFKENERQGWTKEIGGAWSCGL
jgi:hypothetical protein